MKVFLADDERPARERLRHLLRDIPDCALCGEADNGYEALARIEADQPDVVLLDVRMPQMSGIEVAQRLAGLPTPPAVIFTTAYDEYAIRAFDVSAAAYLLKPIRRERLLKALAGARTLNRAQLAGIGAAGDGSPAPATVAADKATPKTHLSARVDNRLVRVAIDDLVYLNAEQKYVTVHYAGGTALTETSLKTLEQDFAQRLLRVHRHTLVAVHQIAALERSEAGYYRVVLKPGGERLDVSRRMVASVRRRLRDA